MEPFVRGCVICGPIIPAERIRWLFAGEVGVQHRLTPTAGQSDKAQRHQDQDCRIGAFV